MQYKNRFKKVNRILAEPATTFAILARENNSPMTLFLQIVLPFALIDAFGGYVGRVLFTPITINEGSSVALVNLLMVFMVQILGYFVSGFFLHELLGWFKVERKSQSKSFSIVAYAFIPVYVAIFFGGLIPRLAELIYLFGFYSIYLFWYALFYIADVSKEKNYAVLPISIIGIAFIYLLIWGVLGAIFTA